MRLRKRKLIILTGPREGHYLPERTRGENAVAMVRKQKTAIRGKSRLKPLLAFPDKGKAGRANNYRLASQNFGGLCAVEVISTS